VDPPRALTVAVTSDRGLCGGLNSNITKYTKTLLKMYTGGGHNDQSPKHSSTHPFNGAATH